MFFATVVFLSVFFSSEKQTASENADIARFVFLPLQDSTRLDDSTHFASSDSTQSAADTTFSDSTARVKYFKYRRKPNYTTNFIVPHQISFFAKPSKRFINRIIEIDSTGQNVIIRELIAGEEITPPLVIPLDKFIQMRLAANQRKMLEDEAYKYQINKEGDDLTDILSGITNISIPLPNTGFLSIFGPPKISLRINGAVDIHGAWRNETTEGLTASLLGNTKNEPDFSQQVQINVSGTIGDKLNISADWNTERSFEYENRLKIKYTGYDDEIIQSIEAGNVSLKTASLIGGSEALFGIKAKFQLGPFSLTTIASQKKGEVQDVDVKGGAQTKDFEIHAWDYSRLHYFIDSVYADTSAQFNFFYNYFGRPVYTPTPDQRYWEVKELEVWKTATGLVDVSKERRVNAFIDLPPLQNGETYDESLRDNDIVPVIGRKEIGGRFYKLEDGVDYTYFKETGIINFNSEPNTSDVIAVAFRIEGPTASPDDDIFFGEFQRQIANDTSKTVILKLVKPKNLQPGGTYKTAWSLLLKNIYAIGGREIKKEGFELDLKYAPPATDPINEIGGKRLLQSFGLDQTDASGSGDRPDGEFDFFPSRTILPRTGEIIFPVLQPFGKQLPSNLPDSLRYQAVYDTTVTYAKQDREKDRFLITGHYSAAISSVIDIGFNVVENSVKVYLGNQKLVEGKDYRVDYNIGQVTILNDAALVPGADLRITFEQNDLMSLASKTLIGARGIYEFNKDTKLGFSFLNLNQQSLNDKVRLGEEPLNNTIMGIDFQSKFDMPFVTKALNSFISTNAKSSFSLSGEYAYINPDPNTKKSTITEDNSRSIAYLDDFEGAKKTIPIGVSYVGWKDLSQPDSMLYHAHHSKWDVMNYKGKTMWFNPQPSGVVVKDIWPEKKVARENNQVTVLDVVYDPSKKGQYNYNEDWDENADTLYKNWGGMVHLLSSTASNLIEQNIEFIEFWAYIGNAPPGAKMYIDLGQISEDIIPNGELNTEDKEPFNDRLDEGEDTGIDGLPDAQEPGYDPQTNPDPSNDNFRLNTATGDYEDINGTEGNAKLYDLGIAPDTEDLNHNFSLDKVNNYFRYAVSLDTNRAQNPFIAGGGHNGWYQFKIPLKDFVKKIGSPTFTFVEAVRFWFQDVNERIAMRMTEINLVGNQWLEVKQNEVDDEVLTISTVSIEDNPEYYSPQGVIRERDRTKPDQEVYKNEQSLDLIIKNLPDGESRSIVKYLPKKLDVFNYKELRFFVHGEVNPAPDNVSYGDSLNYYNTRIYFRFGSDTLNFYEYSFPLEEDWKSISVVLEDLSALKQARDLDTAVYRQPVPGKPNHFYGVKGNPSLTKISFFMYKIENPAGEGIDGQATSGSIWLNELRLLEADDTPGWAYKASASLKLADLLTINGNMMKQNPFFHKVNQSFGSREDKQSWGVNVDFNILKLLPFNTEGSNLSLTYQHSESMTRPLYLPSSDIAVDKAAEQLEQKILSEGGTQAEADNAKKELYAYVQSMSVNEAYTLSNIRIKLPSRAWYIDKTINALSFSYNFSRSYSRNPSTSQAQMWTWKWDGKYSVNLGKELEFKFADIPFIGAIFNIFDSYKNAKFRLLPNSLNAAMSLNRKYNYSLSRQANSEAQVAQDFTATRTAGFTWTLTHGGLLNLSTSYKVGINSSLAYLLYDENGNMRSEKDVWNDILNGEFFGRNNNFTQSFALKTKPKLPKLWKLDKYFQLNGGYNVNYTWRHDFRQEELGRSAGYSNTITAGLTLKWKALTSPLFPKEITSKSSRKTTRRKTTQRRRGRGRERNLDEELSGSKKEKSEKTKEQKSDKETDVAEEKGPSSMIRALRLMLGVIKWTLFDYDKFSMKFNQKNQKSGSGLRATGTGFSNFWGAFSPENGPSRAFMLGLSNDIGPRAPNATLSDKFSQNNGFSISTQRPLWEGANIDIDWKVDWGINKSYTVTTDDQGNITVSTPNITGTTNRSFLVLPYGLFGSGIKAIHDNYNPDAEDPASNLSEAFVQGLETLPFISQMPLLKDFATYIPRPNWRISWSGLEKISFLKKFVKRASLSHGYSSSYTEGWKIDPDGKTVIQTQRVNYTFQPLIGVNLTFSSFWGGNMTGAIKYGNKTTYDLGVATRTVTEGVSSDLNIQFSFSKSGFSLPLFGINLKNDLEFSFSYTSSRNATIIYTMDNFDEKGKPQDGTTRTTLEPRVKYIMSSRITLSIFYRRTKVEPEGASRIPPTTTNEAGLDVHIAIQ